MTDSDSLFPVSCCTVPWMMFRKNEGFCLHQLNSRITSDLCLRSTFSQTNNLWQYLKESPHTDAHNRNQWSLVVNEPRAPFGCIKNQHRRSPWLSDSTVNWDSLSILIMISDKQRRAKITLILFTERWHVGRKWTIQLRFLTVLHTVTTCFPSL